MDVAAALLPGDAAQEFCQQHAERQKRYAAGIERARQNRKLVTAAELQQNGVKAGKQMGALLEEAEGIAVEQGLEDPALVLAQLRSSPHWPAG